ncbi:M23 family metallopeptidase [Salinithrix halophila]|uniref:M23 family metallopeptidase n=1 Tax=Salinithrix halophila TaxID=1485204 RepID=A0ABV8JDS7_9BACL
MEALQRLAHRWQMVWNRKGAATVEFVSILPLALLISLALWQLVIFGVAIMDTHSAIRDAVKIASTTGDVDLAEEEGKASFGKATGYKLKSLKVKIENHQVKVRAKTDIPFLFMNTSAYTYSGGSEAPLLNNVSASGMMSLANGSVLPGGKLASPVDVPPGCGIIGCYSGHTGQDFPGPIGTEVKAAEAGIVKQVTNLGDSSYGTYIVIDHGGGMETLYAHMYRDQPIVQAGERVERGQPIGAIGNNGNSSGPHLHFEVKIGGRPVDPMAFLR